MKQVLINSKALIINGVLEGHEGIVISFDSIKDEVGIKLDEKTTITISSDNIEQDAEKMNQFLCPHCGMNISFNKKDMVKRSLDE